ncbi:rhamnan synthesis F family protein [Rhizobium sp. RHZ01]|uniref:rhamnan synthesis F family protein n=1 Tax=Rhizobium sp. RHZ01 TaxID=2769304 RepID=UPI00177CBA51|nr:rhamnan synthesis F family protein [Rhizobium sp. RHZ01]MBD9443984.1 hypothetical protein [Rhizobium sp. RHZ01]
MHHDHKADFIIFAHVFYPEIWEEMANELDTIVRQPFGLVITRPASLCQIVKPKNHYLKFAIELEVENRGRDILPFLTALNCQSLCPWEIGLKLHTKKSQHRNDGEDWRRFLSGSLLRVGRHDQLLGYKLLISEPRIGLVAPEAHLLPLRGRTSINERIMLQTLRRMGNADDLSRLLDSRFPSGSMFWFRRSAMQKVTSVDFADLFVREGGQLDGTAAHALERLFAFIAEQEGLITAGIENAESILGSDHTRLSQLALTELISSGLTQNNPYTLPLAEFWRRHPALLKCAHAIYAKLPKNTVRLLRRSIGRR